MINPANKICGNCACFTAVAGMRGSCPHIWDTFADNRCEKFMLATPFADLTTMGANVTPEQLAAHPDFVPPQPMPGGEPDHHALVRRVHELEQRVKALEQAKRRPGDFSEVW